MYISFNDLSLLQDITNWICSEGVRFLRGSIIFFCFVVVTLNILTTVDNILT